ncbi:MAG: hypothetical protein C0599_17320 [Salinivirgaceae bacterium]|nr:MAG: hypothetical protein C0599_17320 [Salinivirgaceae bacterium]
MEKFLTKYLSLILLGVVVIITLTTLFRVPDNLEKAVEKITKAERKIDSSIHILKGQSIYLDSLIKINEDLLYELDSLKKSNAIISTSINKKLNTAKWYLQKIKADIEKFPNNFDNIH